MFSVIGNGGSVSNLNIANATVSANPGFTSTTFSQWVGILAGQSGGTISNVTVSGTVSGLSLGRRHRRRHGRQHGILGPSGSAGTITNSRATCRSIGGRRRSLPRHLPVQLPGGLVGANVGGFHDREFERIRRRHRRRLRRSPAASWAERLHRPAGAIGAHPQFLRHRQRDGDRDQCRGGRAGGHQFVRLDDHRLAGVRHGPRRSTTQRPANGSNAGGLVGRTAASSPARRRRSAATSAACKGAAFSCAAGDVASARAARRRPGRLQRRHDQEILRHRRRHRRGWRGRRRWHDASRRARRHQPGHDHEFVRARQRRQSHQQLHRGRRSRRRQQRNDHQLDRQRQCRHGRRFQPGRRACRQQLIGRWRPWHRRRREQRRDDHGISASGAVSVGMLSFGGGFVGGNIGTINTSNTHRRSDRGHPFHGRRLRRRQRRHDQQRPTPPAT